MPESDVGNPEGICVLAQTDDIAVADTHYHRVVVFDRSGATSRRMIGQRGAG